MAGRNKMRMIKKECAHKVDPFADHEVDLLGDHQVDLFADHRMDLFGRSVTLPPYLQLLPLRRQFLPLLRIR